MKKSISLVMLVVFCSAPAFAVNANVTDKCALILMGADARYELQSDFVQLKNGAKVSIHINAAEGKMLLHRSTGQYYKFTLDDLFHQHYGQGFKDFLKAQGEHVSDGAPLLSGFTVGRNFKNHREMIFITVEGIGPILVDPSTGKGLGPEDYLNLGRAKEEYELSNGGTFFVLVEHGEPVVHFEDVDSEKMFGWKFNMSLGDAESLLHGPAIKEDLYSILEVGSTADASAIKKAYRKLAMRYHPDRNPGELKSAEEKFKQVSLAYEILGNAEKKAQYDRSYKPSVNTAKVSTTKTPVVRTEPKNTDKSWREKIVDFFKPSKIEKAEQEKKDSETRLAKQEVFNALLVEGNKNGRITIDPLLSDGQIMALIFNTTNKDFSNQLSEELERRHGSSKGLEEPPTAKLPSGPSF